MHRAPSHTDIGQRISLADVISERGTSAAVLQRIAELRAAGLVAAAHAIERELAQIEGPHAQRRAGNVGKIGSHSRAVSNTAAS
ncbi:hypothetical protein [Nocardia thraciensis]